jgi:hypothetical protein
MAGDRSMTIEYKDSKRIVKLSTDTVETITLDEDFSSYADQTAFDNAWVSLDTAQNRGNPTNDNLDVVLKTDNSDDTMAYDLGSSLSDTAWVCRFKWNITGLTRNNVSAWHGWIGLSSTNQTGEFDDLQDSMGLTILTQNTGGNTMFWYASGSSAGAVNEQNSQFDDDVPTGTYYIEMIRNADVITVNVYTNSNYTTLFDGGSNTITGTVTGLRYFKVANKTASYSGTITSTIDDLKIWNGVTSISSKPSNVQDNSLLVEKDIGNRFWFSAESARTPTFEDDFSSDNWTDVGTQIGVSGGKMAWNALRNGSDQGSYYDIGTANISETEWILDFTLDIDAMTEGSANAYFTIGLSDTATMNVNTSQDHIGLLTYMDTSSGGNSRFMAQGINGGVLTGGTDFTTADPQTLGLYYLRIRRTSATECKVAIYSDSDYSTLVEEETVTITSGLSGLRYLKLTNLTVSGAGTGVFNGTMDNVKFYNAVTSTTTPATWTMPPTLEYDLSTSAGWTTTGSNCSVNTTGQYLEGSSSTNDDRATKALGLTLSDTKFVIRQKMELVTVTSSGNSGQLYFGYTDKDNSTTVLGNRDGIGITIRTAPDMLQSHADGQAWQNTATLSTTPASSTTYYLELIRNSSTSITLNLYSDSDYSTLVETKTNTIASTIVGLNHITIGGWDNSSGGVITARFSDIQIYNGVTSIN